jgi:hypothetical protein
MTSINSGAPALPRPSKTMVRISGSMPRVSRAPSPSPGPMVKRVHAMMKRTGTGRPEVRRGAPATRSHPAPFRRATGAYVFDWGSWLSRTVDRTL